MADLEIRELDVNLIDENIWNPNAMSDAKFNKLVEEIETLGFMDPIQVVPLPSGRFRVVGGAHRLNACLILGYEKVPAFILNDERFQDIDMQKFITLRLNLIRGKMTPDKFMNLYEDLVKRHSDDEIRDQMAMVDKGEWDEVKKELLGRLKEAVKGTEFEENFDEIVKELKTIDDITKLLEMIYQKKESVESKTGKTLVIGAGGGKLITFNVNEEVWDKLCKMKEYLTINNKKLSEVIDKKNFS